MSELGGKFDALSVHEISDAPGFRRLMGTIQESSNMNCGQIAAKSGMPRSTAYSMSDTKRPGLPGLPQVKVFIRACGLNQAQAQTVLDKWDDLNQRLQQAKIATNGAKGGSTTAPETSVVPKNNSQGTMLVAPMHITLDDEWPERRSGPQAATWADLVAMTLGRRTNVQHLLLLIYPLAAVAIVMVFAMVFLVIKVPSSAPWVLGMIPMAVMTSRRARRFARRRVADSDM